MAQVGNNEDRLGGEFMIQDRDHAVQGSPQANKANRGNVRQSEQSHSGARQQGSGDNATGRQGGRRQAQ